MCIQVPRQNCTKSTSRGGDIFQLQGQSRLGPFPNAIIYGPSCKSLAQRDILGWPPKTRTCLAQSLDFEQIKSKHRQTALAFGEADVTATMRPPFLFNKTRTLSRWFRHSFRLMTQVLSKHISSLTSDHPRYFESFRPYFRWNLLISVNPYQTNSLQACNSKYSKN